MQQDKIDMFFMSHNGYFPVEFTPEIKSRLEALDDNKSLMVQSAPYKDPTMMLVVSILVGELGVDRFLLGDIGLGVLKLITCGGCGIWWLIDLINIMKKTRQYNYQQFLQYSMM